MWGDYGRLDSKVFMGVVQIRLRGLELSSNVIGWYKLFPTSSMTDASGTDERRVGSMTSLEAESTSCRS